MSIKISFKNKFLFLASLVIFASLFFTPISANAHNIEMSISNHSPSLTIENSQIIENHCSDMSFCNTPIALLNSSKFMQNLKISLCKFRLKYQQNNFDPLSFDPPPPRILS